MNKRTKALNISAETKQIVYARDDGRCILCGRPGDPVCHFIPRSQGGLGVEQNIVTLCYFCHMEYDQTSHRPEVGDKIESYLRSKYKNLDNLQLTYRKD